MTGLPLLPTRITRLRADMDPAFVHAEEFGEDWFVLGPEHAVHPHAPCRVYRWTTAQFVHVTLGELVAARVVHHQPGSRYGTGDVRYVLAKIETYDYRELPGRTKPPWRPR
jgi:hypothetical protein